MKTRLAIYGVDEYQGALMSRRAAARGICHIGAGRDIARVATHANATLSGKEHPVEPRVFGLGDVSRIASQLDDVAVLINCATPFGETAAPLIAAAFATGTHYLDLGSSAPHLASVMARDADAVAAGVTLMSGVSFDFAAAEAVAARLATLLPMARALTLAAKRANLSRAEARELVAALRRPGEVAKNGQLVRAMPAARMVDVDFGKGPERAALAPWRGEAVACRRRLPYSSIETFEVLPAPLARLMRRGTLAHFLFRRGWRAASLERRLAHGREGIPEAELQRARAVVWGEARTPDGRVRRARLETPAAPIFGADAALLIAQRLVEGAGMPGFRLPSEVAGAALVEGIEGVTWREIADAEETLAPDPVALADAP